MATSAPEATTKASEDILHLLVVTFHHQDGNKIESSYPPLTEDELKTYDFDSLPFVAMPDGIHLSDLDHVFFTLPPRRAAASDSGSATNATLTSLTSAPTLYGVVSFRQIKSEELLHVEASDHVSRSYVQKSVCVLMRRPLFGAVLSRLEPITEFVFRQRDFHSAEAATALTGIPDSLRSSPFRTSTPQDRASAVLTGIPAAKIVGSVGARSVLSLLKLAMAEMRVVVMTYRGNVHEVCDLVVLIASLFPGLLASDTFFQGAETATTERERSFGFPLRTMGGPGMLFSPYVCLQQIPLLVDSKSFFVGASNMLFKSSPIAATDAVFDVVTGEFTFPSKAAATIAHLTSADRRFADAIDAALRPMGNVSPNAGEIPAAGNADANPAKKPDADAGAQSAEWLGSDDWVRGEYARYIESFLCCVSKASANPKVMDTLADFNELFLHAWRSTSNFVQWRDGLIASKADLASLCPPLHPGGPSPLQELQKDLEPYAQKVGAALGDAANTLNRVLTTAAQQAQITAKQLQAQAQQAIQQQRLKAEEARKERAAKEEQQQKAATDGTASATAPATSGTGKASDDIAAMAQSVGAWFNRVSKSAFVENVKAKGKALATNVQNLVKVEPVEKPTMTATTPATPPVAEEQPKKEPEEQPTKETAPTGVNEETKKDDAPAPVTIATTPEEAPAETPATVAPAAEAEPTPAEATAKDDDQKAQQ